MTNNNRGPAFGFMLTGIMIFLIFTNITINSNSFLIAKFLKMLDGSFPESRIENKNILVSHRYFTGNEMMPAETGPLEILPW